jgi:hypothetical protein
MVWVVVMLSIRLVAGRANLRTYETEPTGTPEHASMSPFGWLPCLNSRAQDSLKTVVSQHVLVLSGPLQGVHEVAGVHGLLWFLAFQFGSTVRPNVMALSRARYFQHHRVSCRIF